MNAIPSADERNHEPLPRIFLAVPITDRFRDLLEEKLSGEPVPGRRVPPENWHMTLRFLGATPVATMNALVEELRSRYLAAPFDLKFGGLGAFPRPARASVVWLGIDEGADALAALASRVEEAARNLGLPAADHPFRAHLTLGRLVPPGDVRSFLQQDLRLQVPMPVDEVVLFRSHLGRGPAAYEPLERIALTG